MHATVSGCGDNLVVDDAAAIEAAKRVLLLPPGHRGGRPRPYEEARPPSRALDGRDDPRVRPGRLLTSTTVIDALVDEGSFFELKPLFAPELVIGWARLEGRSIGIVANNPASEGGRAVHRLGGQGGTVHLVRGRVQRAAAVPRRRARAS